MDCVKIEELRSRYPRMFEDMPAYGLTIGVGWRDIVLRLLARIDDILTHMPIGASKTFRVTQIKEKFGGLRFYMSISKISDRRIARAIIAAENEALRTCEACGAAGKMVRDGKGPHSWFFTRCDNCKGEMTVCETQLQTHAIPA